MDFSDSFEKIYDSVKNRSEHVEKSLTESMDSYGMNRQAKSESYGTSVVGAEKFSVQERNFQLQQQIRPLFGKDGVNDTPIGTHPDFVSLEGTTETTYHYMCTLFVDIKGSTRLSLLYDLETVFLFKNAVISACVETVRSFDGYIHRIMGDAVLAFFGGKGKDKEDAIADAINCCVTLRAYLEESIKPFMTRNNLEAEHFGFRIGCDFGDDTEILWGNFGIESVGEVSATGLPVDMASKLQGLSSKNQTMLGQGLLNFIDWPDKYSSIKKIEKDGQEEVLPLVVPNYTQKDGTPLNYKMRQLAYKKCMEFIALPSALKESITKSYIKDSKAIEFRCFVVDEGNYEEYISASRFLEKSKNLKFEVRASTTHALNFPLTVKLIKTNHGSDTPDEERDIEQPHSIQTLWEQRRSKYNRSVLPYSSTSIDEGTQYRGLHTMRCEVFDKYQKLVYRNVIAVLIK
ncbi:adenylate/guanylate cyclase domain-containing protein [Vibrio sp. 10N.286.52.C3]|uniref:nucleotide-binding domain-containing protein n=1 Tax=Vibrio sp. 10N.286.52.C3 TaxID=3229713 RepID=UPI00354F1439